ncbi:MAG: uroporphyrinogen decarboxylase family protein [Oligoflexia bacterium]|nr:uroporphyrinogen decarboxylase family protein [Oligoflexia bacterium]
MNLFQKTIRRQNDTARPPVWFMRQAGRYHSHYQKLRLEHSFIDLCKKPEVACEATMGPIRDFGFDAAILFSDLLFPLEAMGMGLRYEEGPKLDWHLRELKDLSRLGGGAGLVKELSFQGEAMRLIRQALPADKGLLGFVGGPFTLFSYAVEGSHAGNLDSARAGLTDGRFQGFCDRLLDLLAENMALQARAGADTVAVLDTCAGEVDARTYGKQIVPAMRELFSRFQKLCPEQPIAYYSKGTGPAHWAELESLPIGYLGIDWNHDIAEVLSRYGSRWAIQGNVDPQWLFLEPAELERRIRVIFNKVRALPAAARRGWICGLGHGVLPKTPEENVRLFLRVQREVFSEQSS